MQTHTLLSARIIDALMAGPRNKIELRNELVGRNLSYQAFYKAFGKLRNEEVLTVHRDSVSLSVIWIRTELKRLEKAADAYHLSAHRSYFGGLKEGRKRLFRFKTLRELDLFWTQAALIAVAGADSKTSVLGFIPHDYFDLLRPVSSEAWFTLLGTKNRQANVITHASHEERRHSEHHGIPIENLFNENPLKQNESTYYTIVGDIIFQATLDERVLPGIRLALRGGSVDTSKLIDTKGVFTLSIRKDKLKALAFKRKAQKYFTFPIYTTNS